MAQQYYSPLSNDASEEIGSRGSQDTLRMHEKQAPRRLQFCLVLPWVISLVLLSLVAFQQSRLGSIECEQDGIWKPYEIPAARHQIPLKMKQVKFTGGLKIIDGVGLVREIDPSSTPYVGTPAPEIDAAWDEIIRPLNVFVTEKELEGDRDGTSPDPETGLFVAMPQGFHDLHCLNMIRQRLHLNYYTHLAEVNSSVLTAHIDHCIDSLRQSLMCTGDMTLIKTYWIEKRHRMMADFDNVHMCRDFDALKGWLKSRDAEDTSLWRENADRLLAET